MYLDDLEQQSWHNEADLNADGNNDTTHCVRNVQDHSCSPLINNFLIFLQPALSALA